MKKLLVVVLVLALTLTACVGLAPNGPETLHQDGKTYKTDFYGTMYPARYYRVGDAFQIKNITLSKIKHDHFELYHADVGSYMSGTIYCAEADYENALAFYNDPQNYSYYCELSNEGKVLEIAEVDSNKFDALLAFADKSEYDPFSKEHNAQIEKVELPMPDNTKDVRLEFYKESVDKLFVSVRREYYILNDHLYLVYQYDFGHGEYEKLIAVKVPDELSDYFVAFMEATTGSQ